jgi:hypothetical protein
VSKQFGLEETTWLVEELEAGSATATIRGQSRKPEDLSQATAAILSTTELVARGLGDAVPYAAAVNARRLTGVVNGAIPSLSLRSGDEIVTITSGPDRAVDRPRQVGAFGRLTGVVQTLSRTRGFHFRITEETYGRSVAGRFGSELSEAMREVWGKRAIIEGIISRDARTGWPLTISDVRSVRLAPEIEPGAFVRARGVLRFSGQSEPSEVAIRRLRDAS